MKQIRNIFLFLCIACTFVIMFKGQEISEYVREELTLAEWKPTPSSHADEVRYYWVVDDSGWQYLDSNNTPVKSQWSTIDGKDYYFDKDGYMTTGWLKQDDSWYYLDYAGEKSTGWIDDEDSRYYLDKNGVMVTGWQMIDNVQYHFEDNGSLSTGWVRTEDQYYYIDETGTPHRGWLVDNDIYYYLDENGVMKTGWLQDGGAWYYMDGSGAMVSGWQTIDDKRYFFDTSGAMRTGWVNDGSTRYYFTENGDLYTGWLDLEDGTYYMNNDGTMHTGWLIEGKKVSYFDNEGRYHPNANSVPKGTKITLTFDDVPGTYSERILQTLQENDAKATFFAIGDRAEDGGEALKALYKAGNQIGNHSSDTASLTDSDITEAKEKIASANASIKSVLGRNPSVVRPPGGNYTEEMAKAINQPIILWSLDSRDAETRNTQAIVETVLNSVQGGDVILLHDNLEATADAVEILVPALKSMGYDLVTVGQLAKSAGVKIERGKVYSSFR